MNQYLVTAFVDFLVGVIAYKKNNNSASTAVAFTAFSLGFWALELYFLSVIQNVQVLDFWFHITRWGMFFIPPCFALFAWRLMGSKSTVFLRAVIAPGFISAASISIINTFFIRSELAPTEAGFLPKVDNIYYAFVAVFLWCFLGAITLAFVSYRSAGIKERQRIKWLLITLLVSFLGGVFNIFLMPSGMYLSKYMGSVLNILFVALLFYSTIRHHLLDFRFVLSVGIAKAIVLGFFAWCILLFNSLVKPFEAEGEGFFVFLVFMIVMLELYPRILQWLLPNARKLIVGASYDAEKAKAEMQLEIGRSVAMPGFMSALDHLMTDTIKVSSFRVLLVNVDRQTPLESAQTQRLIYVGKDDALVSFCCRQAGLVLAEELPNEMQEAFNTLDAKLGFGIVSNGRPLAALLMGDSENGYYRYDDIRIFEWLQGELGHAIYRILQLEGMQDELGQAKKTLSMLGVMNHYHHDIKAPLAIIDGVLSNDIYDKDKQRDIVLQQVERGSQLIATMAGILKGERRRRVRELSLEQVVKDSLFLFNQGIDEINYDFAGVPHIKGDAEDLKILIINLAKNAMEARRANSQLELNVKTWLAGEKVCLLVSDSGEGIPPDRIEKIWDEADSFKTSGNGIGLQAIKRISDEHGALIRVKSEVGVGTEFVFTFPESIVCEAASEQHSSQSTDYDRVNKVNKPLAG